MNRFTLCFLLALPFGFVSMAEEVTAEDVAPEISRSGSIGGPDSVGNRLATDRLKGGGLLNTPGIESWQTWKDRMKKDYGLSFGVEYNAVWLSASDRLSGADSHSSAGIFRFSGMWEAVGRGTDHPGTLMFLVEYADDYSSTLPNSYLPDSLGYVGINNINYNDEQWRLNTLYWDQLFQDGKYEFALGYLDISDYVDVYPLTSPWNDFFNYAFSIGAGALDLNNDGALGSVGLWWPTESIYTMAGLVDANADAKNPQDGFETFWNDHEFFKHVEIGWSGLSREAWFLNNCHLTLWHADKRDDLGAEEGWGGVLSFSHTLTDKWLAFARTGWSDEGGSLLERSVSIGGGYTPQGFDMFGAGSQLGFGANWGRPNDALFGESLDDQYALETYFRWQLTDQLAVTPSVQLLINPALNPDDDEIVLFGLRARLAF